MADEVPTPDFPGDGVVDVPIDSEGGIQMAGEVDEVQGDIAEDVLDLQLDGFLKTSEMLIAEAVGNQQSSNSIFRHSAARKFNMEDPIEAAAAEKILK